jgi:hypothetical protein
MKDEEFMLSDCLNGGLFINSYIFVCYLIHHDKSIYVDA